MTNPHRINTQLSSAELLVSYSSLSYSPTQFTASGSHWEMEEASALICSSWFSKTYLKILDLIFKPRILKSLTWGWSQSVLITDRTNPSYFFIFPWINTYDERQKGAGEIKLYILCKHYWLLSLLWSTDCMRFTAAFTLRNIACTPTKWVLQGFAYGLAVMYRLTLMDLGVVEVTFRVNCLLVKSMLSSLFHTQGLCDNRTWWEGKEQREVGHK